MKKSILSLAVLFIITVSVQAQQTSQFGTVTGTVTDSSAALVVNANIVAKNISGGAIYKATTNQTGGYQLPAIPAATYTLSVEAHGFAREEKNIPILAGQALELNFSLRPTSVSTDVVVTATRVATELQETPVAVTAVDDQLITQQNFVTARDLAGKTPGVVIQRAGISPLTQVFFIRGIGNSDPILDPNVAQYLDDIYLPRTINGLSDLTDLDRIEVLRGPQGTLFGENADAGAIRYISKTPTEKTQVKIDAGYGNYNAVDAHTYLTGAIRHNLLGSFAAARDQHDGYTYDPTINRQVNDQYTTDARAKLLATPTPDLTVLLSLDGLIDRSGGAYYVPKQPIIGGTLANPIYGPFKPNVSYVSVPPLNHSRSDGVTLKISYLIDPALIFHSISAGRSFHQDPVDYDNVGQAMVPFNSTYNFPVSINNNYIFYKEKEATQEFQLQGGWKKFDFTSGLYFLYEDFFNNRTIYTLSSVGAGTPAHPQSQIGNNGTYNYSAYTQGNYHFTRKLILTLGGRYTDVRRIFDFQGIWNELPTVISAQQLPSTPLPPGTPGAPANFGVTGEAKTWRSFTPKYGLSYQFTPGVFAYGSISAGFDAGGYNNRANSAAALLPYNQEKVTTYEFGFRTDWFNERLRFNPTAFYNDYTNLQEAANIFTNSGTVSARTNAGSAHTEGFELETSAEPFKNLTFTGTASYLDTRFDSFNVPSLLSATGNQLPISPRWQLFGGVSYVLPVDHLHDTVRIGADTTYETSYYSDIFNYKQGQVTPQDFVDGYISYQPPTESRLIFSLSAKNIANNLHYQSITWGGSPNYWDGPMAPPRTVFFKAAYSF